MTERKIRDLYLVGMVEGIRTESLHDISGFIEGNTLVIPSLRVIIPLHKVNSIWYDETPKPVSAKKAEGREAEAPRESDEAKPKPAVRSPKKVRRKPSKESSS